MTKNKIFSRLTIGTILVLAAYLVYAIGTLLTLGPHPYVLSPTTFFVFWCLGLICLCVFFVLTLIERNGYEP